MPFTDLPIATPGPEYPTAPTAPAGIPSGYLTSARKRSIGNASAQIDATKVCALPNITPGAQSCLVVIEAANSDITAGIALIRFWMDGTWPTVISGLPTYDGQVYEIIGLDDMQNARFISTDGNQHVLQVQYFSYL